MPPANPQPTRLSDEQRHILSLLASGEKELAEQLALSIGWDMQAAFQLEKWQKHCWKCEFTNSIHSYNDTATNSAALLRLAYETGELLSFLKELSLRGYFSPAQSDLLADALAEMPRLRELNFEHFGVSPIRLKSDTFATHQHIQIIKIEGNVELEDGFLANPPASLRQLIYLYESKSAEYQPLRRLPDAWQKIPSIDLNWLQLEEIPTWFAGREDHYKLWLQNSSTPLRKLPTNIHFLDNIEHVRLSWQRPETRLHSIIDLGDDIWRLPALKTLIVEHAPNLQHISKDVMYADFLEVLKIAHCALCVLPRELGYLDRLKKLDLSGNPIERLPEGLQVEELRLERCANLQLDSLFAGSADNYPIRRRLRHLRISHATHADNNAAFYEGFWRMPRLRDAHITHCRLTRLPNEIKRFNFLEKLLLDDNRIEDAAPLYALPKIRFLSIRRNRIRRFAPCVGSLPKLTQLNLSGNRHLRSEELDFSALGALEELCLNSCHLRHLSENANWQALQMLRTLDLRRNKLRTIPATLHHLPQLHTIHLASNSLPCSELIAWLRSLPKLKELTIRLRDYSNAERKQLLAALPPKCRTNL